MQTWQNTFSLCIAIYLIYSSMPYICCMSYNVYVTIEIRSRRCWRCEGCDRFQCHEKTSSNRAYYFQLFCFILYFQGISFLTFQFLKSCIQSILVFSNSIIIWRGNRLKGTRCTWYIFRRCLQERQILWRPVCSTDFQSPSKCGLF